MVPVKERGLAILSGACFTLFLGLALAVKYDAWLLSPDLQAALWINQLSLGGTLSSAIVAASRYGRESFWIGLVAVMFLFGDRRTKVLAVGLCAVFIVGIFAGELANQIVARSRPGDFVGSSLSFPVSPVVRIPLETDYSFPSGHALIVSIGAIFTLVTFRRKLVAGLLLLEAAVVSFSRVFTFEHFPTDVLGGVALGGAISLGGVLVGRRYLAKQTDLVAAYLVRLFRDGPLRL